jgi:hypothetical protein
MRGNLEVRPVRPGEYTKNARDPEAAGANPDVF